MAGDTILYISDHGPRSSSILAALEATGYDVVSTDSSTQSIALLFVIHSVTAVVLDQHSLEESSFDLAHSLRALRPDVPIILLCADRIDHLLSAVDYCVNIRQPLENITADLQHLANAGGPVFLAQAHPARTRDHRLIFLLQQNGIQRSRRTSCRRIE